MPRIAVKSGNTVRGLPPKTGRSYCAGIVPGDYRIFSWDTVNDLDYYDHEQLKPNESKGVPISIQKGQRKTVQLRTNSDAAQQRDAADWQPFGD